MQTINSGSNYGSISGNNQSKYTNVGNTYNINVYGSEKGETKALKQRIADLERLLLSKDEIIKAKDDMINLLLQNINK